VSRKTAADLLAEARTRIVRLEPSEAHAAATDGAILVDTRDNDDRRADGVIPGSLHVPLSVLEWRADPASESHDPRLGALDRRLVIVCSHGYSSSLAAARLRELGFAHVADLAGGFRAWKAAGLPVIEPD